MKGIFLVILVVYFSIITIYLPQTKENNDINRLDLKIDSIQKLKQDTVYIYEIQESK